jgi:glycosyltransferase involved in cell wall biosynthesis
MTEDIFFSVIIPTYNRAAFISKTIRSVLEQEYDHFEIIVVDDGSTDNTESIVRGISDVKIRYYKKENNERAAARNFGIEKATGDYVTFLDSDDLFYSFNLSNASECIRNNNLPHFIHLAYEVKDSKDKVLFKNNFIKSGDYKFLVYGNSFSCLGVFIKKEVLHKFRFNEDKNLTLSEDWELWLRLISHFGIIADNRISAAMIYHENRSVKEAVAQKLAIAKDLAIKYAFEDNAVKKLFGQYKSQMHAFAQSYVALHLAVAGRKKEAVNYLYTSIRYFPLIIFSKRFFVIVKRLLK